MQPEKQESTWLYDALAWLEFNRKVLIGALAGLLALVVAGYVYVWSRAQAGLHANEALLALRTRNAADPNQSAASPADFLKVAEEYPSSAAAERALILAAGEFYRDGRYAEAEAEFRKALERDRRGPLASTAALGVAASLDARDQLDAALSAYQAVVADYSGSPASARAKFAIALIHEARNQPAEALKVYQELIGAQKYGRASMEASVKREALLAQHPELAQTNASVTLPPITVSPGTNVPAAEESASALTNKIAGQP